MLSEHAETTTPIQEPGASNLIQNTKSTWLSRVLQIEWLGQTVASLCWIASVFAYGTPEKLGDYLQLAAAGAWLIANIAAALVPRD